MSLRPLSKELQTIAITELNEDPSRTSEYLKHIREWAYGKPHIWIKSDQWLLTFLRGCNFSLVLAKEKLDLLFTLKPKVPEFFSNRNPFLPEIQELLELGICLPLRKSKDPEAPRIILCRFDSVDPTKVRIETGMKLASMFIDILQNEDDNVVVCGAHLVLDQKGITVKHASQLTPSILKKIFKCFLDAYAARPRGCHILNSSRIVHIFFNVLKPFFHSKILDMIHFYSSKNENDIHESVPLSILPQEYGGEGGTLAELTSEWKQKVESYQQWFLEEEEYFFAQVNRPEQVNDVNRFYSEDTNKKWSSYVW